jgi:serpin B
VNRPFRAAAALVAAAVTGLLAVGCGTDPALRSHDPGTARPIAVTGPALSPAAYGGSDAAFGLAALDALCRAKPDGNVVLSPVSLASGLGMAYLGARGATARAMAAVLHLPPAGGRLLSGLSARGKALRALDRAGVTVVETDRLWADPSLLTLPSFSRAVAKGYGAGLTNVPLMTNRVLAARDIDAAIAAATRGHISHLLAPDQLQGLGWVLTDAMYLQANWANPFDPAMTHTSSFATAAGRRVMARYLDGGRFAAGTVAGWTAVGLPYEGGQLEMLALLPPGGTAASSGCQDLSAATLAAIARKLRNTHHAAAVDLPEVSLSSSTDMMPLLSRLGMGQAFGSGANFTGISPEAGPIALVWHAATLQVDEEGTVASAATAVGVVPTALQMALPAVNFDRPYLMVVLDKATGEPLFMARVANPDRP